LDGTWWKSWNHKDLGLSNRLHADVPDREWSNDPPDHRAPYPIRRNLLEYLHEALLTFRQSNSLLQTTNKESDGGLTVAGKFRVNKSQQVSLENYGDAWHLVNVMERQ
jgi:hypothetical protein